MKNIKGSLIIEIGIVLVIIGLLTAFAIPALEKLREHSSMRFSKENYTIWVKLTGRDDLTYEEWISARKAGFITNSVINYSKVSEDRIENE